MTGKSANQRQRPRRQFSLAKNKAQGRYWSGAVTRQSNALDLEPGVFTWSDPAKIAGSLKHSAETSARRKGTPYQSAMSMLSLYVFGFRTSRLTNTLNCLAVPPSKQRRQIRCLASAARPAMLIRPMPKASPCAALSHVREEMGLTNLRLMVPFCRRVVEAESVLKVMAQHGLGRGQNGLEIYMMCEIPNNVIQVDAFAAIFDGFSIGSNDLTQLTLGVDRDSEIVAFDFDERDPGMLEMLRLAVAGAKRNGRHVGICGEAPSNYPEIAQFLTGLGINSISVNPSSLVRTIAVVREAEQSAGVT